MQWRNFVSSKIEIIVAAFAPSQIHSFLFFFHYQTYGTISRLLSCGKIYYNKCTSFHHAKRTTQAKPWTWTCPYRILVHSGFFFRFGFCFIRLYQFMGWGSFWIIFCVKSFVRKLHGKRFNNSAKLTDNSFRSMSWKFERFKEFSPFSGISITRTAQILRFSAILAQLIKWSHLSRVQFEKLGGIYSDPNSKNGMSLLSPDKILCAFCCALASVSAWKSCSRRAH